MRKRQVGIVSLSLAMVFASESGAGELLLANGSRLDGELANEVLVVSTGADLVEVTPEQVAVLSAGEVRLKDGRVVRGTLVGGHLKIRTALGEIAVKPDELRVFRADSAPLTPPPQTAGAEPGALSATLYRRGAQVATAAGASLAPGTAQPAMPPAPMVAAVPAEPRRASAIGRRLEVIAPESSLRRDAASGSDIVGKVARGDLVTYVDSIDRRLRILNVLVFDGGHWIKVRAVSGGEGWLPAQAVQELR
ncbi:MAG: hypothetical protein ACRELA_21510 [Candidatus Rokuibacteriota bacterium]